MDKQQDNAVRSKPKKPGRLFRLKYWFIDLIKFLGWIHLWILFRPKYLYEEGATRRIKGRVLVTSNHGTWFEAPLLIMTFFTRRIHFMMAKELFDRGFKKWFFRHVGCVPIVRGEADSRGVDESAETLLDDRVLTVFPEGGWGKNSDIRPFKAGAGLIALRTGATLLPVYIDRKLSIFHRAHVVIGRQLSITDLCDGEPNVVNARLIVNKLREKTVELKKICDEYLSKKS